MISVIILWMCLSQHVFSKVITVNSNSTTNCTNGTSLYDALQSIENKTTVIITSKIVLLERYALIELEYLNNVTIKGNDVVVMCNNTGGMSWRSSDNILIEGITWDQCGNPRYPPNPAIEFDNVYNISIIKCTFRYSKVCTTVYLIPGEEKNVSVHVINSSFTFNKLENASSCPNSYGSLVIRDNFTMPAKNLKIIISRTTFEYNGNLDEPKRKGISIGIVLYCYLYYPLNLNILIEHSTISSNEILGMFLYINATFNSVVLFKNVTVYNNSKGGVNIVSGKGAVLNFVSSHFVGNNNGTLMLEMDKDALLTFNEVSFLGNKGAIDSQGVALYVDVNGNTLINLFYCNFDHNIGGGNIVYITAAGLNRFFGHDIVVLVCSSSFVNNRLGSPLHISQLNLQFCNFTLFENNSAESGAAIYVDQNSFITITDESFVQFANNSASLRGGAIYSDLSYCFNNGLLFSYLSNISSIIFINNVARISGNSIYFSIPKSCNVQRNYTNIDSVAYIPHKLKYVQSNITVGAAIAASPYFINLCSPYQCSFINEACVITEEKMLGQSIYFNVTVCDYFNFAAETVLFHIECVNCGTKYKILKNELLVNNRLPGKISMLSMNAHHDIVNDVNITLEISSILSDNYKKFSAKLSLTLSACYNGFLFSTVSQKCECYNSDGDDIVQCQEDQADIKLGYWYGIIYQKRTTSLCPINYCDFNHRIETRSNFYNLPKLIDDQCSLHRTGVACSDCKSGYTLAYDSLNCVHVNQCSPGMTVLVISLTVLYWIVMVTVLFGLTYHFGTQVSSGYFNGVIYFYSIFDILVVSDLYFINGLFYTVAILTSFAKMTPQFLGKFCIAKGLDAIDQQFMHYSHTLCISFILIGIAIAAKYFQKVAFYVNRCIKSVTYLFLIISYTSVTSTSLQLLRGIQYNDIDGVFVYLSPHLKYFTHQHAVYAPVALLCGLFITVGLPLLLLIEPFLRKKTIFDKITPLLNPFQDSYKDNYQWFAGYYLLCRLVIMLIAYFGNSEYSYMVYYIQTACVVIVMNHIFIWPYKKCLINVLDATILLIMLLVVNLNNFDFSESIITGLIYTLLFIPLLLLFGLGFTNLFTSLKLRFKNFNSTSNQVTIQSNAVPCEGFNDFQEPLLIMASDDWK